MLGRAAPPREGSRGRYLMIDDDLCPQHIERLPRQSRPTAALHFRCRVRFHGVMRVVVGKVSDFANGDRKIIEVNGKSIGVFRIDDRFYALRNRCPHQFGPLCLGTGRYYGMGLFAAEEST